MGQHQRMLLWKTQPTKIKERKDKTSTEGISCVFKRTNNVSEC